MRVDSIGRGPTLPNNDKGNKEEQVIVQSCNPADKGVYIPCSVAGVVFSFLLDTGASRSIISEAVYNTIPDKVRPSLEQGVRVPRLLLADGTTLATRGCIKVQIHLGGGSVVVEHECVVAAISDSGILGLDFLRTHQCQINLSSNVLTVVGKQVNCCRVQAAQEVILREDEVVPARTEMIVRASTQSVPSGDCSSVMFCPRSSFSERTEVQIAFSLSESSAESLPIRIMNPGVDDVHLYKGSVLGHLEPVEEVIPFLSDDINPGSDVSSCEPIQRVTSIDTDSGWPTDSVEVVDKCVLQVPSHLEDLYQRSVRQLSQDEAQKLSQLLVTFQNAFAKDDNDLGKTTVTQHRIDTGTSPPIRQRPRRTPLAFMGEEEKEIARMKKKGVIEESTSPWSSPVVLVRKKNGSVRFCIDYRKLNAVTVKDSYPLPRIEDCFDALSGSKHFSTMDLASGYWQIEVHPQDQAKTAFVTKSGLYQFTVLPFGLANGPSTFERCMETVLHGLQWQTCLIYLDDIIVFAESLDQHFSRLSEVLMRIQAAGLKLNAPKCHFLQTTVPFLGHVISASGVTTDPRKIIAVRDWAVPQNVSQLRSFLGFCSYYRRFISNFSQIANPLSRLTQKGKDFIWSSSCQLAFDTLKSKLISAPILALPTNDGQFILDTDASGFAIGAVLSQVQDQQEKVIAYASRSLNRSEQNYCVTRRELLAIVNFLRHFRHYLLGREFLIRCDHQPLKWIFNLRDPSGQVARWLEQLASYDFEIEYRSGKQHGNADGMSRCVCDPKSCDCPEVVSLQCGPCSKCERSTSLMSGMVSTVTTRQKQATDEVIQDHTQTLYNRQELQQLQEQDPDISPVLLWVQESVSRPKSKDVVFRSPATRSLWLMWDTLQLTDGVLYTKAIDGKLCLVVPRVLRNDLLKMMHDNVLAGHLGYKKTLFRLRQRYYWYHMKGDVYTYVLKCHMCAANRRPSRKAKAALGDLRVGAPMDRVGVDLLGPFPVTPRGNKLIMVVQDYFTKWVEVFPISDGTAQTCATVLVNEFFSRFGLPLCLHSDQGRNFESDLFHEMCSLLNIKKTRTSPRHPACNGLVERFNSTLVKMIKSYMEGQQTHWDVNLGCLASAYRSTQHESTGFSPNLLMMGREVRLPAALLFGEPPSTNGNSFGEYVEQLRQDMERAHDLTRVHLQQAARRQKENYDVKLSTNSFKAGDLVWLLNERRSPKQCFKLQNMWLGPYVITRRHSDLNFEIQTSAKGTKLVVHHDKLKPYESTKQPKWVLTLLQQLRAQT